MLETYVDEWAQVLMDLINKVNAEDKLLVVDDVHDTGNSINQIILDLKEAFK